jgi:hypothetical protein
MSNDTDTVPDPLEKRPRTDQGDTAVPREGDIAQAPQTVDEETEPCST